MAKGDLIKFITERVVTYIDTPKETRKQARQQIRVQREPWSSRWFGMIPFSIQMWIDRKRKKDETPPSQQ